MSAAVESRMLMGEGGFQRWVKLSTDDLPLIRPPRHHMLAHMTGGLTSLYEVVKETKKEDADEVLTPYHDSEAFKNEPPPPEEKEETSETGEPSSSDTATETKNGHTEEGECAQENGVPKAEEETNVENDKNAKNDEGEETRDKKEDEGGGDKKKEEDDEEEEGKDAISKKELEDMEADDDDDDDDASDEETTPYTDEEGEFAPEKEMPLLAGRFKYSQVLARGQSAIIIKVLDTFHKDRPLAIKVLHRVYKPIGSQEADILLELHRADPWLHVPFARLLNQFLYGPHYCLVFEYLSPTPLYTHYDQRDIREATALPHIRDLTVKLLTVLGFLYKQNVIHADLKPENILLRSEEDLASLMVVDFGNALRNTDEELSLYYSDFELQTLLYRAPEVIFGMKFSLEVDMWSLGCLLAECYLGEPLFMGKTKKEILNKITALLGPFPREFNDGEYAQEFAEFIGRPMSRYQRLENLRKRLNDCKDSMFLMLVERLLTYLPDRRFTPFEAACHPFVACSTPFLYLTPSPGYIRYPTVLLDMSTYPYLPGLPDDEDEDSASAYGRKRLALFSRHNKRQQSNSSDAKGGQKDKGSRDGYGGTNNATSNQKDKGSRDGQGGMTNAVSVANQKEKGGRDGYGGNVGGHLGYGVQGNVGPGGKTATRSDVKETLKSMGLRCEDFTISVYSREQAHAILRRQGVEVTPNNVQSREKLPAMIGRGGVKNTRSSDGPRAGHNVRAGNAVNPRHASARFSGQEEDDDDCVILDPPDTPKSVPKLPHQFQLMGTTVQVNRGAKRPSRPMPNQPQAKRSNARPMMYYRKEHESDYGSEASVQDTLKRLKNYNISITCRRNTSGMRPHGGAMDSESDMENDSHIDSDDGGEDMSKYLDCQIGEIDEMPEEEIFEDEDFAEIDDDKTDLDYNPRGKKRKQKSKSPRKGKKSVDSASTGDKSNRDSGVDEVPDMVPNIELGELSDQQGSNHSENEYDHDPLAEENDEDNQGLREIMENAVHLQEEEKEDGEKNEDDEENNMEEQLIEEQPLEDQSSEGQPMEDNLDNSEGDKEVDTSNENMEEDMSGDFTETKEPESSPAPNNCNAPEDDDEIDEELEKELLGESLGNEEEEEGATEENL